MSTLRTWLLFPISLCNWNSSRLEENQETQNVISAEEGSVKRGISNN